MAYVRHFLFRAGLCLVLFSAFLLSPLPLHADERTVRIGLYENEPKIFSDPEGRPRGFFADLVKHIAAKEQWDVQWIPCSWNRCLESLEAGDLDLMVDVGFSVERTERFDFNQTTALTNWAILYTRKGSDIDSIPDLSGTKIAVMKGDVSYREFKEVIKRFGVENRFVETSDFMSIFKLVHDGRADAGLISRLFGYRFEKDFDVQQSSVICCPSELRFAVAKGMNPDLIAALDKHLAPAKKKKPSFYHSALNTWIGSETQPGLLHRLKFTLVIIFGVAAYLFGTSLVLNSRVRSRTKELSERNEELQREIRQRVKAEKALRESEEKYRTIFESAQVGLARADEGGRFLEANQAMAEAYGYDTPEQFMQEFDMDAMWVNPQDRARMLEEASSTGMIRDFEIPLHRRDGSIFWARIYGKHLPDYGFYENVLIDITERKIALQALEESEARNRALLNAIPDLMFHFRRDGTFLNYKEPKGHGLFLPPEVFLGKKVDAVMPPEIAMRTLEEIGKALERDEVRVFEYQLPSIDDPNEIEDFEARVVACGKDEALAIVRDITERKRSDQALRKSENMYRTIFETTGNATVLFGEDTIITLSNTEFTNLSGYTREETEGKLSWTRIFDEESVKRMLDFHRRRSRDPDSVPRTYETTILDKSGKKHDGIINIGMVPGTQLRVASFLDLTEKKRAEQQMFRAEKMAALGQIIAGVAHEINNPNNFIYFNLPILKRYIEALRPLLERAGDEDPDLSVMNMPLTKWFDDVFKLMDNMHYGSKRITGIVSELRTYIRSHEVEEKKPENLRTVIDHVMTLIGKQVRKMVRHFDVEVADALPDVEMNAGRIEQVLINMLINAGQASDKENSRVRLVAGLSEEAPGQVEVRIEDNGSGIPDEILEQIFDPFFTTKGRESGTGLGLSIAHRIIEEHEGTIDVSSQVGKGTTFVIRLPACQGENP